MTKKRERNPNKLKSWLDYTDKINNKSANMDNRYYFRKISLHLSDQQ